MADDKFSQSESSKDDTSNLKGTLAAVFILGVIIVAVWIGVFSLYLQRS